MAKRSFSGGYNYGSVIKAARRYITPSNVRKAIQYAKPYFAPTGVKRSKTSSPAALTVQHDYRQTYKKKNMPKYKRKAWKKFSKKVLAVANKDRGLVTVLYNRRIYSTDVLATQQCVLATHLYGHNGDASANNECGQKDLATIVSNNLLLGGYEVVNTDSTLAQFNTGAISPVEKIMFESAVLDMTLFNPTNGTLEVDVYTIVYKKFNVNNETKLVPSFADFNETTADVAPMQWGVGAGSSFPKIDLKQRGATPFEMGQVLSRHGISILKKEKFYISAGQSVNKQFRDAKNRYFDPRGYSVSSGSASNESTTTYRFKDYTKTFLVVAKNVNPASSELPRIEAGVTRTYKYTYEGLKINKNYCATF